MKGLFFQVGWEIDIGYSRDQVYFIPYPKPTRDHSKWDMALDAEER
jgi:hypothetical protein